MKKVSAFIICLLLFMTLCGCNEKSEEEKIEEVAVENETVEAEDAKSGRTLVVYFSATGTTKGVAEKIAALTDADIYEIVPLDVYTNEDLNYNDKNSRTTKEQDDKSIRPVIASETINLDGYDRIFIGYPIWWAEEPRIMDSFVESYDFSGKTMIPFCTSGGSGIGRSGKNLEENAGSGNWLEGKRLKASISDSELNEWLNSYN
ncbi:MAG: NAD(P)H-dependent oxidoreductase [Erysipelotrichaceae bacterium]|nr:NAD(P)H-dependent oxidoreductase [Erysipelotrichaceae bacterium]